MGLKLPVLKYLRHGYRKGITKAQQKKQQENMIPSKYIPGTGPSDAKLAIVGEAPGYEEDIHGVPFYQYAPSGRMLNHDLNKAGSSRNEVYITNVVKYRPPNNKIKRLNELGIKLEDCKSELYKELTAVAPNCILAIGNTALEALTGKTGIKKWRGSLLPSLIGIKCVPTIHPANIIRQRGEGGEDYIFRHVIFLDIVKALKESNIKETRLPQRTLEICRSNHDLVRFLNEYADKNLVSLDIEVSKCIPTCIALAFHAKHGMSVPLVDSAIFSSSRGLSRFELSTIYQTLLNFLNQPRIKYIGQNFKFDHDKLIAVSKLIWPVTNKLHADTSLMMGLAYPEFERKLAFMTSIFTNEPYYKDEGKEFNPKKDSVDQLYIYNCKDACVTYEVYTVLLKELEELGLVDFYFNYQNKLHDFYMKIEAEGLDINEEKRSELVKEYQEDIEVRHKRLEELVGHEINVRSPKLWNLLYEELKFPERENTQEDTLVALLGNHCENEKKKEILGLIIDERQLRHNLTYLTASPDYDGRMRTSFRII